jgi:16S rRNA processing protein RimM
VELLRIGRVVRAVGLKGHVGVAGTEGALGTLERIAVRRGDAAPTLLRILEARPQGKVWAVLFEGVQDRTAAEAMVGVEVLAAREDLGEAGTDAYWWADLVGLPVVTAAGAAVGEVTGLYETGGVDVLVVTTEGDGEKLVPLAPYVEVDREGKRIVVDPPEGLLD